MKTWKNKIEFKNEVKAAASKLDIKIKTISFRRMTKKWASCSTGGYLSFNAELLEMDKKLGEYVIVHELLHFHVPNHGKLWKSLMRAYLGNYERIENKLQMFSK